MLVDILIRCDCLKNECMGRLGSLRQRIDDIEKKVIDDTMTLNDLGEFQSETTILDCLISTLAELRKITNM